MGVTCSGGSIQLMKTVFKYRNRTGYAFNTIPATMVLSSYIARPIE